MSFEQDRPTLFFSVGALLLVFILFQAQLGFSVGKRDVVINEIAWMGTEASYSDEWIELYNRTEETIDIAKWTIYKEHEEKCLNFSNVEKASATKINPYSYLIIATDSDAIKRESGEEMVDITADFRLNNDTPKRIIIYDSSGCTGNEIDSANQVEGGWFAGQNTPEKTMERVSPCEPGTDSNNWATHDPDNDSNGLDSDDNPIKGTPKAANSAFDNTDPVAEISAREQANIIDNVELDGGNSHDCDGEISSYSWDLDEDGEYDDAGGETVYHSFDSAGNYEIGLKVSDADGGDDVTTKTIEVNDDPRCNYDYSPGNPVAGEEIQFSGEINLSEDSVSSWEWNFDGRKTTNSKNPSHVFPNAGTYTVTLTVTSDAGEQDSRTKDITVESPVSVEAGNSQSVTLGESVKLKGSVSTEVKGGKVEHSWEVTEKPDGSKLYIGNSTGVEPLIVPNKPGKYELKLAGSDSFGNGASDETTITVTENSRVDGEELAVDFISQDNRTFDKREEVSLEAEIKGIPESARGSVIGHGLESWPEFDVDGRLPASFRDLKVTRLEEGTAEVRFYYEPDEIPQAVVEESLKLLYHLPDKGWNAPADYSIHPESNYVSGVIPVSELKGTPLTLAGKTGAIEGEDLVVHGPNPVPEAGCIFWLNLPEEVDGAEIKIYDSAGKPVFEESLTSGQERFPEVGRWKPVDKYGNRLDDGMYFYRIQLVNSEEVSWSDVKKLVIGG